MGKKRDSGAAVSDATANRPRVRANKRACNASRDAVCRRVFIVSNGKSINRPKTPQVDPIIGCLKYARPDRGDGEEEVKEMGVGENYYFS